MASTTVQGVWVGKSQFDDAEKKLHSKSNVKDSSSANNNNSNKKSKKTTCEPKIVERIDAAAVSVNPSVQTAEKTSSSAKKKNKKKKAAAAAVASGSVAVSEPKPEPGIAKNEKNLSNALEKNKELASDKLDGMAGNCEIIGRLAVVEAENKKLHQVVDGLQKLVISLGDRLKSLEGKCDGAPACKAATEKKPAPAAAEDDDVDLFGDDDEEEDAEAAAVREKRLADYAAKKSKKPALIAKSSILLDVKPWDDETDMKKMEELVRKIEMDGLLWGASKLVPVGYGINKLQIMCVIEDDKVSIDLLTEQIEANEDFVQSVDIAAFNKI